MKNKYLIIVAFFLLVQPTYAQSNSFLKIFDNGELGKEYVGEVYEEPNCIYLFSSVVIDENLNSVIALKCISKTDGTIENKYIDSANIPERYEINGGVNLGKKHFFTGFHKTANGSKANDYFLFGFDKKNKIVDNVFGKENISDISRDITADNDSNVIICGQVWKKNSEFDYDTFISKHDTLGNTIWHTLVPARYSNIRAQSVTTDNENNIYVLADVDGFGQGIRHIKLIKLDTHGDTLWTKPYIGGSGIVSNIIFNRRGNLLASVTADFDGQGRGFTLMEIDTNGKMLWSKSYHDVLNANVFSKKVIELKNGGYAVALRVEHPVLLIFDEDGNVKKSKIFKDINFHSIKSLLELDDGSFVLAGNIHEFNQEIPRVMWLLKTDPDWDFISTTTDSYFPDFKLYPNPTDGIVYAENIDYSKVWVINVMGQLVKSFDSSQAINMSDLPSGNYFLYFETKQGTVVQQLNKK